MNQWLCAYKERQKQSLDSIPVDAVAHLIGLFQKAWRDESHIFVFGNGGSAANASHFITDLGKGASDKLSKRFRCLSLNDNVAWMTAIGNDYCYEDIYLRQLQNFAKPGDMAFALSVSGNSPNVVKAFEWAKAQGLVTVALGSARRGRLAEIADVFVGVDSTHYGQVEDAHMSICHMICCAFMETPSLIS